MRFSYVSRDGQRRLVAALASLVAAVRARVLDRGTCATFSPTAVLLLLLVASLLDTFLVLNTCGAMSSAGHMQLCWLLACAGASTS